MKTKTGRREINPTDAFRKEQRRREIKKNKTERKKVRTEVLRHKDLDNLYERIQEMGDCELDKARKAKKRALEEQYEKALEMHKENPASANDPHIQAHILGNPILTKKPKEQASAVHYPNPEDSVYYHATLNPLGLPPPGKAQQWRVGFADPLAHANLQRVEPQSAQPPIPLGGFDPANLPVPAPPPRPPMPPMPPRPPMPSQPRPGTEQQTAQGDDGGEESEGDDNDDDDDESEDEEENGRGAEAS
eukprot:CAMPEP_0118925324 /NCGR_PEP_ID=MMETSP1169-20130426/3223_1 /TAXON_ID=36882 /ORGANISM="Pyramimonas obovata, Strain CCMP722" /LENGTH=246 /DNA_ID=CAMNT_0006866579 /DNA_START=290 /DNA_END=1026 /DNA_ORIENTATION=-